MRKSKGLSLVEITISMAILILVMLPSFLTISSSNHGIKMTESEFRAHSAAIELMEQIISLPFYMLKTGVYDENDIKNGSKFANTSAFFHLSFDSDYKPKIVINDIVKNKKVKFKKITVTINYPITKGADQRRDFVVKVIVNNDRI